MARRNEWEEFFDGHASIYGKLLYKKYCERS